MWNLHARSKEEYIRLIETFLERQETENLREILPQAFDDYRQEEDFAAWCTSVAYGTEQPDALTLMARFMEMYPLSLHPVQVDWAENLVRESLFDEATNEARAYLNRVYEVGLKNYFEQVDLVRDGCSRAFLLLTSAYTEVGARSYSLRVIEYAMLLHLEPYWQSRFQTEYIRISEELRQNRQLRDLDDKWELFFRKGSYNEELLEICHQKQMPVLAKRAETILELHSSDEEYVLKDEEFFQLLYRTDSGKYVLV